MVPSEYISREELGLEEEFGREWRLDTAACGKGMGEREDLEKEGKDDAILGSAAVVCVEATGRNDIEEKAVV